MASFQPSGKIHSSLEELETVANGLANISKASFITFDGICHVQEFSSVSVYLFLSSEDAHQFF